MYIPSFNACDIPYNLPGRNVDGDMLNVYIIVSVSREILLPTYIEAFPET